jgi:hypothetical protein
MASSVPPQNKLMVVFETPLSNSYGNINSQPENEKEADELCENK